MKDKSNHEDEEAADMLHRVAAEEAIRESEAQLKILRLLSKVPRHSGRRIMEAACAILQADACVPGVIDAFMAWKKK